jgi:hypothetical protein
MSLDTALEHLRRFRATFNDGDDVDEESGLTAEDLDVIIRHNEGLVSIQTIDLNDPRVWAGLNP